MPGLDPQAAQGATGRASKKNFSGQKLGEKKNPDGKVEKLKIGKRFYFKSLKSGKKKKKIKTLFLKPYVFTVCLGVLQLRTRAARTSTPRHNPPGGSLVSSRRQHWKFEKNVS